MWKTNDLCTLFATKGHNAPSSKSRFFSLKRDAFFLRPKDDVEGADDSRDQLHPSSKEQNRFAPIWHLETRPRAEGLGLRLGRCPRAAVRGGVGSGSGRSAMQKLCKDNVTFKWSKGAHTMWTSSHGEALRRPLLRAGQVRINTTSD
jgi:hypothetical protein